MNDTTVIRLAAARVRRSDALGALRLLSRHAGMPVCSVSWCRHPVADPADRCAGCDPSHNEGSDHA